MSKNRLAAFEFIRLISAIGFNSDIITIGKLINYRKQLYLWQISTNVFSTEKKYLSSNRYCSLLFTSSWQPQWLPVQFSSTMATWFMKKNVWHCMFSYILVKCYPFCGSVTDWPAELRIYNISMDSMDWELLSFFKCLIVKNEMNG